MADRDPLDVAMPQPATLRRARWVAAGVVALLLAGALALAWSRQGAPPPPPAIAGDPVLVRGFEIYTSSG